MRAKVVFKDGMREKAITGEVYFEDEFIRIIPDDGKNFLVNKSALIFMREVD